MLGLRLWAVAAIAGSAVLLTLACENLKHQKVPSEAKPQGFAQLARWDSCGATGEYCSEVIIFGRNGTSFDDAVQGIETRYVDKGWSVRRLDNGELYISNSGRTKCVDLKPFDLNDRDYVADLSAPSRETLAKGVEPYSTVIDVTATTCA